MMKAKLIASAVALALIGALVGCASAGSGSTTPYAGPHNHQRDAKQGPAPSETVTPPPARRKSLRPVS